MYGIMVVNTVTPARKVEAFSHYTLEGSSPSLVAASISTLRPTNKESHMSLLNDKDWVRKFHALLKNLPTDGVVMEIPMSCIVRDNDFNARLAENESATKDELQSHKVMASSTQQAATQITELAEQIRRDGLLTPLTVRPLENAPGKVSLVAGFRRHSALQYLKAENVRVLIKDMSEVGARIMNLAENMARKDLKPYEVAKSMRTLKMDHGLSYQKIGELLGCTKGYVTFLQTILDKGHPRLLRFWADGKFPGVLTVDNMYQWASKLNSDEQVAAFEDVRVRKGFDAEGREIERSAEEKAAANANGKGPKAPNESTIRDALARAEGGVKGKSKEVMAATIAALRWVLGEVGTLDGWYDQQAEKEAIAKREKVNKAKEKARKAAEEAAKLESELK